MKDQDSLVRLQTRVAELEQQKLTTDRELLDARKAIQKGRLAIVAALEKVVDAHRAGIEGEVRATLEQLRVKTTVRIVMEIGEKTDLTITGFNLGDGVGKSFRTDLPMTEKDWKRIFGFSWNEEEQRELLLFKKAKGQSIHGKETGGTGVRAGINSKMKIRNLPYAIWATEPKVHTRSKKQRFYRIYIVV